MKRSATIITTLLLSIAFAVPAVALGNGSGEDTGMTDNQRVRMGNRASQGSVAGLTDEQREKIQSARKAFLDETTDLRNNLRTKHTELTNLLSTAEPDAEKARAIQKEISDLQAKLAQRRIELRLEILKINPDARYRQGLGRRNRTRLGS